MLCGISFVFNSGDVFGLMSCKRSSENGQVLVYFQLTEAFGRPIIPTAVQRNAIAAFRHRFTLRQTRRTVFIIFSIEIAVSFCDVSPIACAAALSWATVWSFGSRETCRVSY
jgi:hypothetical protein